VPRRPRVAAVPRVRLHDCPAVPRVLLRRGRPRAHDGVTSRRARVWLLGAQIVDRRLFKEAELRPFLAAVVKANKQIDAALLKEAVRDVEREFFLVG
jgi:hypothetical protein